MAWIFSEKLLQICPDEAKFDLQKEHPAETSEDSRPESQRKCLIQIQAVNKFLTLWYFGQPVIYFN